MNELPAPLTIIKRGSLSDRKVRSLSVAYPHIPCRSSSLAMGLNHDSNEATTSTRTPSLSDSLYNIEIMKLRSKYTTAVRGTLIPGQDADDDPFVDNVIVSVPLNFIYLLIHLQNSRRPIQTEGPMARNGYHLAPRLLVRWSSGSWNSLQPGFMSTPQKVSLEIGASTSPMSPRNSRPDRVQSLSEILHQGASNLMCPLELPIAFANMRSYASRPYMEADYMSVWTSVNISVDVNPIALPETAQLAPLDIIILFDWLQQPSPSLLTPMIIASTALTSKLIASYDRLALTCVNGRSPSGFDTLLPLGFHSAEAVHAALNVFSIRQMKKHRRRCPDLAKSIQKVSQLFCPSSRNAFCHLVLVSASSPKSFLVANIDKAVGFHTVSPQTYFPVGTAHPPGWHICSDTNEADADPSNAHFARKINKIVRQLRTGMSPGVISDLRISVGPGNGCWFEAAAGDTHLMQLRPGETWIYKLKIGIPLVQRNEAQLPNNATFRELIAQINDVLKEFSCEPALQQILTAGLEYEHSFLPKSHTVCLETHCTISRTPDISSKPVSAHQKISTLMAYEDDDDSFDIISGSASESS
ncbi:uncharacterized protein N7511_006277 [Penicillium nucicola]|uniref:uncharacterized protein n=1 Tax=Penicillium nucicola TaxID=1850975 RepID=UPI0025456BE3|nr:uncharacterized protein N7511_006277 [Penicillium nucicola]KAJ5757583.1 hypothetical protein N7511_006277 [Penicillium nucicola]